MSSVVESIVWLVVPALLLVAFVLLLNWYDNIVYHREVLHNAKKYLNEQEVLPNITTSELDAVLARIKKLSNDVAEVETQNQWYGSLDVSTRSTMIRDRQLTVLESLGDDMERYLQEVRS